MPVIIGGGGFEPVEMVFTVAIPNFPEWAIPMTKVIPRIYIDDSQNANTTSFVVSCNHVWSVAANKDAFGNNLGSTVLLTVSVSALAYSNFQEGNPSNLISTYLDIDLVFLNERNYSEINNNKS